MTNYIPLSCHTHYSLLRAFTKPDELAKKCAENNMAACAITDYNSLSGVVSFYKACKKQNIKAILGSKLDINGVGQVKILSMNKDGWSELLKIYHSRDISDIINSKNLIVIFGDSGSFIDTNTNCRPIIELLKQNILDRLYCEIQIGHTDKQKVELLTSLSDGVKIIATPNVHYIDEISRKDLQLLLCSHMKTTFASYKESKEFENFKHFFDDSLNFGFMSYQDMIDGGAKEEWLQNTTLLSERIEDYSILDRPRLPKYEWTEGLSEEEYLKKLCREGYKKKLAGKSIDVKVYGDRANMEFDVIFRAGLSGYFLIVQDYIRWAKSKGVMVGSGRGCFLPDTRIKSPNNILTPISMIAIGDIIIDAYGDEQKVYNKFEYSINEDIMEIEFENNIIIRCTKDHKFLTNNRGWVEAQYLCDNDDITEV